MKDKTIVIKYGSATVASESGINYRKVSEYARSLAALCNDYNVVLVCSGSVAAGNAIWSEHQIGKAIDLKVLAMLGSAAAFSAWQHALAHSGILAGQLLVTHREVDDSTEGPSLLAAIRANMQCGIVTIINENDALSDIELAKLSYGGDNDGLAAHVAIKLQADTLLMLTNVDGLKHSGHILRRVEADAASQAGALESVEESVSTLGRGGMRTKVQAAIRATEQGIAVHIASARADLYKVLAGSEGTHFVANDINE